MKKMNVKYLSIALISLALGLFFGWLFFHSSADTVRDEQVNEQESTIWTCSMHPQIRKSEPGKCPICGMDLIPLDGNQDETQANEFKMSAAAMQLAQVQTTLVSKEKADKEIRLSGMVKVDERKIFSQASHIPGRIESLEVSFTGEEINKGQVLAYVYSPELVTAQEELLDAWKRRESSPELYQAAREKLKNWKLSDAQLDAIVQEGKTKEKFPILAGTSGIVISRQVNLGDYIKTGAVLYEVADLSKLWVLFDVYEEDLIWIKKGDEVKYTFASLPGKSYTGKISFIDPVFQPNTRVAKARVELNNPGMQIKPDMFATGLVKSTITGPQNALVIPKSAVLWTGERSVVYLKRDLAEGAAFHMTEITLGPELQNGFIVLSGLKEGDEIVTQGTFAVDAAAQLAAKPSMMNPELQEPRTVGGSETASTAVKAIIDSYIELKAALFKDELKRATASAIKLQQKLKNTEMGLFKGEAHLQYMKISGGMTEPLKQIQEAKKLEDARTAFQLLSAQVIALGKSFGPFEAPLYIEHCPMADGGAGADWLNETENIQNPYFGSAMPGCGEVIQTIK